MVSKRGGEGKDKNDQKDYLETHSKRKIAKCWRGVCHFNSFHIHLFLPTLYLAVGQWKSLDKRTSLTNCPSQWPVRHHYPPRINSLYKPFAYSPVRETAACFGGQSNLNTQLTVIGIKLRCRDERLENTIWYTHSASMYINKHNTICWCTLLKRPSAACRPSNKALRRFGLFATFYSWNYPAMMAVANLSNPGQVFPAQNCLMVAMENFIFLKR